MAGMESLVSHDNRKHMSTASSSRITNVSSNSDLGAILEPVASDIAAAEELLETNLIDDNPFVSDLLAQVFQAGGKRIRAGITLLASRATQPAHLEFSRLHIVLAVLTETIHTASLVHDDVIDGAALRRGKATVNRKWNDRLAVLLGDLLFAQASICLARIMNPVIVGIYGQVLGDLCAGEIRQMRQQYSCEVDWDGYIRKSVCKTASLFAAGSHSGAILNASSDDEVKGLKEYGLNLGICFQIVDDLLDVTSDTIKLGKPAGSDLQGGLLTAPALSVLQRNDEPSTRLRELIRTRRITGDEGTTEALEIIRSNGGVEATVALCQKYAQASRQQLLKVRPSRFRDSLEGLIDYVLTRTS
jgi:all-trans-nonaprenyl-diphosphate synthase